MSKPTIVSQLEEVTSALNVPIEVVGHNEGPQAIAYQCKWLRKQYKSEKGTDERTGALARPSTLANRELDIAGLLGINGIRIRIDNGVWIEVPKDSAEPVTLTDVKGRHNRSHTIPLVLGLGFAGKPMGHLPKKLHQGVLWLFDLLCRCEMIESHKRRKTWRSDIEQSSSSKWLWNC